MDPTNCEAGWSSDKWFLFTNASEHSCQVPDAAFQGVAWTLVVMQAVTLLALGAVFLLSQSKVAKLQLLLVIVHGILGLVFHAWTLLAPVETPFSATESPLMFFLLYSIWLGSLFYCSLNGAYMIVKLSLVSVPKQVKNKAGVQISKSSPWDNHGVITGAAGVTLFSLACMLTWAVGINLVEPSEQVGECRWCGQELFWKIGCVFVACTLLSLLGIALVHTRTLRYYIEDSIEKTKHLQRSDNGETGNKLKDVVNKLLVGERVAYVCGGVAFVVWLAHAFVFPMFWWIALLHFLNSISFQIYEVYLYRPSGIMRRLGLSTAASASSQRGDSKHESSSTGESDRARAGSWAPKSSSAAAVSATVFADDDPSENV